MTLKAMRGQALVLALALLSLGGLMLLQSYRTGQLVHERSRLSHVADAVAYSGALAQARALNLLAYLNRAQLAHQTAMAHLATLASWSQFGQQEQRRVSQGNPPVHLVTLFFGPVHGAAYAAARAVPPVPTDTLLAAAYAGHDALVHNVLARLQQQIVAEMPATRQAAMQAVLDASYAPGETPARLDAAWLDDGLPGFLTAYPGTGRGRQGELLTRIAASHPFLAPRNHTARNAWLVQPRCPTRRHELRRRGQTTLNDQGRWQSHDTQSLHALRANRWIGCYFREYPMGWGETRLQGRQGAPDGNAETTHNAPDDFSAVDFWRWALEAGIDIKLGRGNALAAAYARRDAVTFPGRGLATHPDVAPQRVARPLRLAVRVVRDAAVLPLPGAASAVRDGAGRLRTHASLPGQVIAAVAAAETHFERLAPRLDQQHELPNLFHPYWHARLAPVSAAEQQQARARQEAP